MAISDEITRLQSAKAALKTAINAKNDSSHQIDDETLEDYAGFVDLIHDALPAAYTELEYIESSGTQYIDTGVVPTVANGTEIYLKMAYAATTAQNATGANNNLNVMVSSGKWRLNAVVTSVSAVIDEVVEFVLKQTSSGRYYSINNESGYGTSNAGNNHFCLGVLSGVTTYTIAAKFYKCSIKENDTIIKNLVPAKRNSDGVIGMYDKVSGTFFTNSGTGEFIAPEGSGGSATLVTKTITENGTYDAEDDSADGYSEVTVNVQPPQEAPSKDVNFYDYDGKILYSYTASEFAQLTALPANPTHDGWTSKGWNWTLADAKTQVTNTGKCDIGQMYRVTDGKTRLYCHFNDEIKSFYFTLYPNGTVTIDWGDGSATSELTGTSRSTEKNVQHTYATGGDYVITLSVSSGGNFSITGGSNGAYLFRKDIITTQYLYLANAACLKKAYLGEGVYLGNYAFNYCGQLEEVLLPDNLATSVGTYLFNYCYALKHVTVPNQIATLGNYTYRGAYSLISVSLPKSITKIGSNVFYNCYSLQRLVLPPSVTAFTGNASMYNNYALSKVIMPTSTTTVKQQTFYNCFALTELILPSTVTSIETKAFQNCYGMKEYHFKSTTPPTLGNADAFSNIQSDCKIYVPSAKLTNYQTAQNWSSYSSYMVGE